MNIVNITNDQPATVCPSCRATNRQDRRAVGLSYSEREPFCNDAWHGPDTSKYFQDSAGGSLPPSLVFVFTCPACLSASKQIRLMVQAYGFQYLCHDAWHDQPFQPYLGGSTCGSRL